MTRTFSFHQKQYTKIYKVSNEYIIFVFIMAMKFLSKFGVL